MSAHSIHLLCENPDLLVEFDLPPGTHAIIGASPKSEITLPLGGIPPFCCTIGRFHDGRLYLADLDGTISRGIDLPAVLSIPPYEFAVFQPAEPEETAETGTATAAPGSEGFRSAASKGIGLLSSLFRRRKCTVRPEKDNAAPPEQP